MSIESKRRDDAAADESFQLEFHGPIVVVTPAPHSESIRWDLIEQAADVILDPLESMQVPLIVFDLSKMKIVGSVFLSLLLRCHKFARNRGGELVVCGLDPTARDLLRVTALDTIWAIYDDRASAIAALS